MVRCVKAAETARDFQLAHSLTEVTALAMSGALYADLTCRPDIAQIANLAESNIRDTTERMVEAVCSRFDKQAASGEGDVLVESRIDCRRRMNRLCGELMSAWYSGVVAAANLSQPQEEMRKAKPWYATVRKFMSAYCSTVVTITCISLGIEFSLRLVRRTVAKLKAHWHRTRRALTLSV